MSWRLLAFTFVLVASMVGAQLPLGLPVASADGAEFGGAWARTRALETPRVFHTGTRLSDGRVLVVGGRNNSGPVASAELYEPSSARWTTTSQTPTAARELHTATRLTDGRVLIVGGSDPDGKPLASAELYDPTTGDWTATGPLQHSRRSHTATRLADGTVLVVGGVGSDRKPLATAEIYDPGSGGWAVVESLEVARTGHTATMLPGGDVIVVGGTGADGKPLASAEVYDPGSGGWAVVGSLEVARSGHTATTLASGDVLVVGGESTGNERLVSAEVYDHGNDRWSTAGSLGAARTGHTATLLNDGRVLVAGGSGGDFTSLSSAELYDPDAGWTSAGTMLAGRLGHVAALLADGTALVAGGSGEDPVSAETFDPTPPPPPVVTAVEPTEGPTDGGTIVAINGTDLSGTRIVQFGEVEALGFTIESDTRITARAPEQPTGQVRLSVTTSGGTSSQSTLYTYVAHDGAWVATAPMARSRTGHTATLLDGPECRSSSPPTYCGKILVAGDVLDDGQPVPAELFDPAADGGRGAWASAGTPMVGGETAAVLDGPACRGGLPLPPPYCGRVLVVGSLSAELYDPATGQWLPTGRMTTARSQYTLTLLDGPACRGGSPPLHCGKVLAAGGLSFSGSALTVAELYDPLTGEWTPTGPLNEARHAHVATVLDGPSCRTTDRSAHCGQVLVAGGTGNAGGAAVGLTPNTPLDSVELYDPAQGEWNEVASLEVHRGRYHTATTLPDGRVVVAGGANTPQVCETTPFVEVYDASTDRWRPLPSLKESRGQHSSTVLLGGDVLTTGGLRPCNVAVSGSERYDPAGAVGRWRYTDSPAVLRYGHRATVLDGPRCRASQPPSYCGGVLVTGGRDHEGTALASSELYVAAPRVISIDPPQGPVDGSTTVTITGSGFAGVDQVRFGGADATSFAVESLTTITATSPHSSKAGPVPVTVTTVATPGTSLTSAPDTGSVFTYLGPPGRVLDLNARATSPREVELTFGAVDDGSSRPATSYAIRRSTSPITEASFDAATNPCDDGVCRFEATGIGDVLTLPVGGLHPGTTYSWAVKAVGADGTLGPMSNVVSVTTPEAGDTEADRPDVAPGRVADLSASGRSSSEVVLVWSAAGSDGEGGPPAGEYVVKQSTEPIGSEADFESAFTLCGTTCRFGPSQVGETISLSVTGLQAETRYFYALKAVDGAGNVGPRSNTASASTLSTDGVRRLFGAGRIQTAVELSREAFPGGASHAVVARADDFPDALAASTLAAEVDGPVLLSESGRLSDGTGAELRRLGADIVYLAGGAQALSGQVADDLRGMGIEVMRVAGTDRVGTAAAVAREVVRLGGKTDAAIVVRADLFADALAAGPLAAYARAPVLLTWTHDLPDATLDVLGEVVAGGQVTIAGGPVAVGDRPQRELEDAGYTVTRRAGADRYATAVALADAAVSAGASRATVFAASGRNFPDALAAAPAAWRAGGLLVLVDPADLDHSGATRAWLADHAGDIRQVLLAGGPAAVTETVEDQISGLIAGR